MEIQEKDQLYRRTLALTYRNGKLECETDDDLLIVQKKVGKSLYLGKSDESMFVVPIETLGEIGVSHIAKYEIRVQGYVIEVGELPTLDQKLWRMLQQAVDEMAKVAEQAQNLLKTK